MFSNPTSGASEAHENASCYMGGRRFGCSEGWSWGDSNGSSEPAAIRTQLTPDLAAVFDAEWEIVLESAQRTQDLQAIHDLLGKWRHIAAAEVAEPDQYCRGQHLAERILAAGSAEAAGIATYDARTVLEERLRRDSGRAS